MTIAIPEYEPIPSKFFRLRWRFEFHDRPAKVGVWDNATEKQTDAAWAVNKTGLAFAIIEAEDRQTFATRQLVVVDGHEYASMQWEAYSKSPSFGLAGAHGAVTLRSNIVGLSILTRDEKITSWVNGKTVRSALSDHDKLWEITEHSLGG